jgi:hypothetical protein
MQNVEFNHNNIHMIYMYIYLLYYYFIYCIITHINTETYS